MIPASSTSLCAFSFGNLRHGRPRPMPWRIAMVLSLGATAALAGSTPSSVTLQTSGSPSVYGRTVTLRATVAPPAATGNIIFYDGGTVLGVGTISGGKASTTTIFLPSDANSLTAFYSGDATYASSRAAPVNQTVNVVPVIGFNAPVESDLDAQNPTELAIGDFNGDGIPDVALGATPFPNPGPRSGPTVDILLGKGDGTFASPSLYSIDISNGHVTDVKTGDFNGDGKTDLLAVVGGGSGGGLVALLGNGDGTFTEVTTGYNAEGGLCGVADFNNDGKLDIAIADSGEVVIYFGNGDGTFAPTTTSFVEGPGYGIAIADFNLDGNADFASFTYYGALQVFLGNGDGTFRSAFTTSQNFTPSMAVADFNKDGKPDIAVFSADFNFYPTVWILSGNGDGTFNQGPPYTVASTLSIGASGYGNVAVGDFNADGDPDVIVGGETFPLSMSSSGSLSVRLGQGDGTLGAAVNYTTTASPNMMGLADLNGDGATDIFFIPSSASFFTTLGIPSEAPANPTTTAIGPNKFTVPVPTGATIGTPVVFTEGVPSDSLPNPDFSLVSDGTTCAAGATGTCIVDIEFTPRFAGLRRGAFDIVDAANNVLATYFFSGIGSSPAPAFAGAGAPAATSIYSPGTGYPLGVVVDGAGNAFVTDAWNNQLLKISAGGAVTPVPIGTSLNLPLGLALDAAGNLYIADAGNGRVLKLPYGTSTASALNVTGLFKPQGLAIDGQGNLFIANNAGEFPNEPSGVIEVLAASGTQSAIAGLGGVLGGLAVDAAGDLFVGGNQVIEVPVSGAPFAIGSGLSFATAVAVDGAGDVFIADQGNGRLVELAGGSAGPGTGAQTTLVSGLLMPNGVALDGYGNVFVANTGQGSLSGNVIQVHQADAAQTISFGPITPQELGSSPALSATASSGLPVSFASQTPAVCTVSGSTVTLLASGTCTILASQAGGAAYLPAPVVAQSFTVLGAGQTLTATFTLSSAVTLGTPVVFTEGVPSDTLPNPDFTLVSGGTTCTGAVIGSCTVNVRFTPQYAGLRRGAVKLVDSDNNLVATAYISGIGANSQVPFQPGTAQTLDALGAVAGVTVDGAGHIFLLAGSGLLYESFGGDFVPVPLGTTLSSPFGLALDGAGNLYIADSGNNRILELPCGGGSAVALNVAGLVYPQGVAVDGAGNIFIANTRGAVSEGNGAVLELAAGTHTQTTVVGNGLNWPADVTVDGAGDLFVADWGGNRVLEVSASGAWTSIGSGVVNPTGVAVDGSGDVFILDEGHNQMVEVPGTAAGPGTGTQTTIATGFLQPHGIALDAAGDVFISDIGTAASRGGLVEVPNQ